MPLVTAMGVQVPLGHMLTYMPIAQARRRHASRGFQGECAEEEGADGLRGDDAETLPRGERPALHSDRGLGVQAGEQGAGLV